MHGKSFPVETQHTHLLTTDTESITDQSLSTTKVQFGELISLIGVTYKNVGENYLQEQK